MTSRHDNRPFYYTRAGFERLRGRLAKAREDYLAVCRTNEDAAQAGDNSVWHDNFAYEENQRKMHQLAARVADLERVAACASIVPAAAIPVHHVAVGSRVRLRLVDETTTREWNIAGFDDGDPTCGRISYASPLGAALIRAEEGDVVRVPLDGREREVEVVEILPPDPTEL